MPGMDGLETARHLGELGLNPLPHLMMVTAEGSEELVALAREAGIAQVLTKPVTASMLFDGVVAILGGVVDDRGTDPLVLTDSIEQLASIKGARILLVEDNELNQEVATELLRDVGFVVDLAENGQIALDQIRRGHYDIVLMDMQMPVMDGITATLAIRKEARFDQLPVVAMTANAMQGDRDRCLAAGMNDHVAKPIEPEDLWQALLKWIKPRPAPVAAAVAVAASAAPVPPDGELPTGIDHLDMAAGLRRVLGKKALYLSLLSMFVAGQKSAALDLRLALAQQDWERAERIAHTLKGVCASIGATALARLAGAIEAAMHARQPIDDQIDDLQHQLEWLVLQLEDKLAPVLGKQAVTVDRQQLKAVCDTLQALLVDDDSEAGDVLDANADLLHSAFGQHYCLIEGGIRSFNFDKALAALKLARAAYPWSESP